VSGDLPFGPSVSWLPAQAGDSLMHYESLGDYYLPAAPKNISDLLLVLFITVYNFWLHTQIKAPVT